MSWSESPASQGAVGEVVAQPGVGSGGEVDVDGVIDAAKEKGVFLISNEFINEFVKKETPEVKKEKPVKIEKGKKIFAKEYYRHQPSHPENIFANRKSSRYR